MARNLAESLKRQRSSLHRGNHPVGTVSYSSLEHHPRLKEYTSRYRYCPLCGSVSTLIFFFWIIQNLSNHDHVDIKPSCG